MESQLVQRAQAGDDVAIQELVNAYREDVFRLAYLMLNNAEDAHDIAQETFIRTLDSLQKFDVERPFRPWILTITANLCRNHKRNLQRYWQAIWAFTRETESGEATVERQLIQQEEVSAMLTAVRELRPSEQEIIYLRYFLDLSVTETAQILKVKEGTVKSRLHRALQQLEFIINLNHPDLIEKRAEHE